MKSIYKTQPVIFTFYIVGVCLLLFVVLISLGCNSNEKKNRTEGHDDSTFRSFPKDQLVIWRKPGTTDNQFSKWLDSVKAVNGKINKLAMCQECDNSLMLLTGPGIINYIQQATSPGGITTTSGGKPSGEDGPLYYSVNYKVDFSDNMLSRDSQFKKVTIPPTVTKKQLPVTVAVFDTGIDSTLLDKLYFYHILNKSCLGPTANNGWNFYPNPSNNNWQDDYAEKHGTVVSKFIVNQVNAGGHEGNGIKLLPVKTHGLNGQSNLFNVLCGFSYAAKGGAQIINASFGFYTRRPALPVTNQDSCVLLLKMYVKEYLTKNNILLITAAGNKSDMEETPAFASLSDNNKRNLDSVGFYPASLAADKDLPNVIAVTTVNNTKVSPVQNFSPHVVDIGVIADDTIHFSFRNPFGKPKTVIGSSFAAPIVSGAICSYYYLFKNASGAQDLTKSNIIKVLLKKHLAMSKVVLKSKIINGVVMKK